MSYATLPPPASEAQQIAGKNAALDFMERQAKKNRWRFLCWVFPHVWHHTHLFDEPADYDMPFGMHRGSSHYAGICLRCGNRDLFSGPLRASSISSHHQTNEAG